MLVISEEELLVRLLQTPQPVLEAIEKRRKSINEIKPFTDYITTIVDGAPANIDLTNGWPGVIYFIKDLFTYNPIYVVQVPAHPKKDASLGYFNDDMYYLLELKDVRFYDNMEKYFNNIEHINKADIDNIDRYLESLIVVTGHTIRLATVMPTPGEPESLNAIFINRDIALEYIKSVRYGY